MKTLKLLAVAGSALIACGTAHAQTQGAGTSSPSGAGYNGLNPSVHNPGDTTTRDAERARDEAIARERSAGTSKKAPRSVPATAADVTVGAQVFDSKGVAVGTITEKTLSVAVLQADTGKVEVPLEALGKNSKGLLIAMTKAEFDKLVAAAQKPAG